MVQWKGIYPALTTPFLKNNQLDLDLFEKNLETQVNAGVHGIIIGGSLGEASTLEADEKRQLIKCAGKLLNGRIPIILNIAEASTKDALQQVVMAEELSVDGLML